MMDEVDKIGMDFRGDPSSALLEVLDPEQNNSFTDHYLGVPFDLSKVLFITTANLLEPIQPAFRDRMEVIEIHGYTEEEKIEIARRHLIPRQVETNGLNSHLIEFTPGALKNIIALYTREAGVRNLEREIGGICRKVAHKVALGERKLFKITIRNLEKYAGIPKLFRDQLLEENSVGVATGMAWTPYGGDILFIEVKLIPGKGTLILTGSLGDVMKESASAALSLIKASSGRAAAGDREIREERHPYPYPRGRHPQGRPLGRHHPGHGADLGLHRHRRQPRDRHDRRDHPARQGPARGRHQGKGAGGAPGRHPHHHPAREEQEGPERAQGRPYPIDEFHLRPRLQGSGERRPGQQDLLMDERRFVAFLQRKFPFRRGLGIGDDASVVRSGKTFQLISTDLLIEDVHFRLRDAPLADLAEKALAVNISDIAAMGGRAQYFYLGLGFPDAPGRRRPARVFFRPGPGRPQAGTWSWPAATTRARRRWSSPSPSSAQSPKPVRRSGARPATGSASPARPGSRPWG